MENKDCNKLIQLEEKVNLILENLKSISELSETIHRIKYDNEKLNEFQENFEKLVKKEITTIVGSADYSKELDQKIEEFVKNFLQRDSYEQRLDERIVSKVKSVLKDIQLTFFWKVTLAVSGILGTIFTIYLKGYLGG